MERLHAPNEFFRIRRLCEGMRAWEELWRLLADGPRAGRATTAETPCAAGPDLVGPFMAVVNAFAKDGVDHAEPLTVDAAYAHSCDAALAESAVGTVGLEIEVHLVDLDHVADSVSCKRVETIAAVARNLVPNNAVTVEPGGQIELSGRPTAGISAAVARLRYESTGARLALADQRLGLA
jgi:gamma-glutamylcysteine synthetase